MAAMEIRIDMPYPKGPVLTRILRVEVASLPGREAKLISARVVEASSLRKSPEERSREARGDDPEIVCRHW
jgi:hypothetical protein